jgi:hypothetical protein
VPGNLVRGYQSWTWQLLVLILLDYGSVNYNLSVLRNQLIPINYAVL